MRCIILLQRPRSAGQYLSQQEFVPQEEEDFILGRKYNVLEKFNNPEYQSDHGYVSEMDGKGQKYIVSYYVYFIWKAYPFFFSTRLDAY